MKSEHQPYIPLSQHLPEITLRVVVLSVCLTLLLATSNAYLALKIGILTSASIPAAIISMGILHFFRNSNILENNLVQTAASAGEAVAGGIVYTVPALIIIGYWHEFAYWENVCITLLGGCLGVFFSIPLRQVLVSSPALRFPEGQAIYELLKLSSQKMASMGFMLQGGIVGAALELCQTGFKIIANSWQFWMVQNNVVYGFGAGFSATMIGAGYLIGFEVACSIFLGALLGWGLGVPIMSHFRAASDITDHAMAAQIVANLWNANIRYIGIGAMLFAGIWTLFSLAKPLILGIKTAIELFTQRHELNELIPRTSRDIPLHYNLLAIIILSVLLFGFFYQSFPLSVLGLPSSASVLLLVIALIYILVIGFIFSGITGYFSGLVGVSATPGSSIIIAGMLIISVIFLSVIKSFVSLNLTEHQLQLAESCAIITGSVLTGIACIANDNIQDLKVGYLLGATPWKQQVMLLLGVCIAALVIPPVMQLLFDVYGIAGVLPHAGMNPDTSLPAPPAALMAAITTAVFHKNLPWTMIFIGALLISCAVLANALIKRMVNFHLSILGLAIGIYLPLASSIPLFIGGLIAWFATRHRQASEIDHHAQRGILIACGLVAGAALMDVLLAIPFSILHSPDALKLVSDAWLPVATVFGFAVWLGLGVWFYLV